MHPAISTFQHTMLTRSREKRLANNSILFSEIRCCMGTGSSSARLTNQVCGPGTVQSYAHSWLSFTRS
jgi:hypothetical protein